MHHSSHSSDIKSFVFLTPSSGRHYCRPIVWVKIGGPEKLTSLLSVALLVSVELDFEPRKSGSIMSALNHYPANRDSALKLYLVFWGFFPESFAEQTEEAV